MSAVITNATYHQPEDLTSPNTISCVFDGEQMSVPIKVGNRHYDEIKRQVDAGTLTIQDAA
jgi:hypothetical protein